MVNGLSFLMSVRKIKLAVTWFLLLQVTRKTLLDPSWNVMLKMKAFCNTLMV